MISPEELEIVKGKIADKKKRIEEFQQKIRVARKSYKELRIIKEKLSFFRNNPNPDEENNTREINDIKAQIAIYSKGDPEGKKRNRQLKKQLLSLENELAGYVEQIEIAQAKIDSLNLQEDKLSKEEGDITHFVQSLESKLHVYHNYKKKFPLCASTLLYIVDLESQLKFYQNYMKNSTTFSKEEAITSLNQHSGNKKNEFDSRSNELLSINQELEMKEKERIQLYSNLKQYNEELSRISTSRRKLDEELANVMLSYRAEDLSNFSVMSHKRDHLKKLTTEITLLPEFIEKATNEQKQQIHQKEVIIQELQKKIQSTLVDISQNRNQSPVVIQHTKNLEQQWKEHEMLANRSTVLQQKLYKVQDFLERKKLILEEMRRQVVIKQEKPGMPYLLEFYNEQNAENRRLEAKLKKVTRNLEIYQAENAQYLGELNENL